MNKATQQALGKDHAALTLHDQTPRVDLPEQLPDGQQVVYLRGISVRVPMAGITDVIFASSERSTTLTLEYGASTLVIEDSSTEQGAEELRAQLLKESLASMDAVEISVPEASQAAWKQELATQNTQFEDRFRKTHILVRTALEQQGMESSTAKRPGASYISGRLLFAKAALHKFLSSGLEGTRKLRVAASGPVFGLLATVDGVEREALWMGPESIQVRIRSEGDAPPAEVWKTLTHSTRPFAGNAVDAKHAAKLAKTSKNRNAQLLGWASAARLDPKPEYQAQLEALRENVTAGKGKAP